MKRIKAFFRKGDTKQPRIEAAANSSPSSSSGSSGQSECPKTDVSGEKRNVLVWTSLLIQLNDFSWMTLVEWLYSTSLASFCLSVIRNPSQCPAIDNYSFITYYFSLCHLSLWIWLYHYIVKNTWIAIKTQLLKEGKKARIAKFPSKVVARTPVITVWTNAMFCKVCQKTGNKNAFSAEKGCTNFQTLMPTRHISGQDRKNAVGGDTMHGNMKCSVERTFSGTRLSYHCRFLGCILACKR